MAAPISVPFLRRARWVGPPPWVGTLETLVRLPVLISRVRETMEPFSCSSVAKIVVCALGEFVSHVGAVPDLVWLTKERDGGSVVNSSVLIHGPKAPTRTQYLDMMVVNASLVGKCAVICSNLQ